jgi:hypothetical protein
MAIRLIPEDVLFECKNSNSNPQRVLPLTKDVFEATALRDLTLKSDNTRSACLEKQSTRRA